MTSKYISIFYFPMLFYMVSCTEKVNNIHFSGVNPTDWNKNNPVYLYLDNYNFNNMDINILIRTTELFKYDKLNLEVETLSPDYLWTKDTISIILEGNYRINDVEKLWLKNIYFNKKGEYRFKFTHLMPDNVLKGVSGIGIKINENGKE